MKLRSPLVTLVVVCLFVAGLLQPIIIRPGYALTGPTEIKSWSVQPGGNPSVIVGYTEVDLRLYPRAPSVQASYNIYDTSVTPALERLRLDTGFIADERYSSVVADVVGDSQVEIITVTPNNVMRCIHRDGLDVWTRSYGVLDQFGCPSLYDLDDDGNYEVIAGLYRHGTTDLLVILNAEDGTVNQTTELGGTVRPFAAPVIGDADDDGEVEIIISGEANRRVYSIDVSGAVEWQATYSSQSWASPTIGDFDADGQAEVIVVTENPADAYYFRGDNGNLKRKISTGLSVKASPVAGDINNDGFNELIIAGLGSAVVAIDHEGNKKSWTSNPTWQLISTPAIADTDGDGIPEVIVVDDRIRVFDWSGLIWSQGVGGNWRNTGNSPVVFDANSNGLLDVVFVMTTTDQTKMYRAGTTTSSTGSAPKWLTFKNDLRRSGIYGADYYGVEPNIAIDNEDWDYGDVSAGSYQYKDFRISNLGKATLSGNCQNTAKISFNDTSTFSLLPGQYKGYRAIFDTSVQGIHEGTVLINNINDPETPKISMVATANITQPEHDLAAYAIHIGNQLNPNYVNVPPIKVEYRNLGAFREEGITATMTINGVPATPLTSANFNLDPGQSRNVTYLWDRSNPSLSGEGTFTLVGWLQNPNLSIEADTVNNQITKSVEVKWPISIDSVTSYLAQNLTYGTPQNTFDEMDYIDIGVVLTNQWGTSQTLMVVVQILDAGGSSQGAHNQKLQITLAGGQTATAWSGFQHSTDISSNTKYNATVSVYDAIGGGVKVLADPYIHGFWVQPV